jgi:hypothetical protein
MWHNFVFCYAIIFGIERILRERRHWGDQDVDGRIIFRKLRRGSWGLNGVASGYVQMAGTCVYDEEL